MYICVNGTKWKINVIKDNDGRFLICTVVINQEKIVLTNYGLNSNEIQKRVIFFKSITNICFSCNIAPTEIIKKNKVCSVWLVIFVSMSIFSLKG
jgi:hypothetical protein